MSHKPKREVEPTERVIVDVDGLSPEDVQGFLNSQELRKYIRGLEFSYRTLSDDHKAQDLFRLAFQHEVEIIANLQLAGGLSDMVERIERANSAFHPAAVTVAAGVGRGVLRPLQRYLEEDERLLPCVLLTGILPEATDMDISEEFRTSPQEYTESRIELVRNLGFRGLYGAAIEVVGHEGVEYIGLGISLDGQDYQTSFGVTRRAVRPGAAVVMSCDAFVVGHAISSKEYKDERLQVLAEIGEAIDAVV